MNMDKQAHFFAGAAIASTVTLYGGNAVWGLGACVVAAIGKELYDASWHEVHLTCGTLWRLCLVARS